MGNTPDFGAQKWATVSKRAVEDQQRKENEAKPRTDDRRQKSADPGFQPGDIRLDDDAMG